MSGSPAKPRYSLHYRLQTLEGATFIFWLFVIILLFFPVLHFSLTGLLDQTVRTIQEQKETEATTVARLMVLEFSHLQGLLGVKPGSPGQMEQEIKRLLWEKVTFNQVIQGVELIQGRTDDQDRYLTYLFYRREAPELKPMDGPQQVLKTFTGAEKDLIELINREQRVDKNLQEAINRGPKKEGEMLLRYLPLYVPVPEQGAMYWGVAKIGLDTDSLRRFLLLQQDEQNALWYKLSYRLFLCLIISGIITLVLFNMWARRLTTPLLNLSQVTAALHQDAAPDVESLATHLERLDHQGMAEIISIQQATLRLTQAVQRLGNDRADLELQAARGRLGIRLFESSPPPAAATLEAWQRLTSAPREPWGEIALAPLLNASGHLAAALAPAGTCQPLTFLELPPVWGSPQLAAQVLVLLLDFVLPHVTPAGRLELAAVPEDRRVVVTLACSPGFAAPDLAAFPAPDGASGPSLAAALARQQGGSLTVLSGPAGLTFTWTLTRAGLEAPHG